ncbi:Major tail tube protein FII [Escherichia coli]|nr:Major tail tube protein FII [Escherichia coli]
MAVPKHLRFFTLFVNGENEVGKVTSVTPPKLTRKTESYRGGGMMGAVSIDLGLMILRLMRVLSWGAQFVSCSLNMAARLTARCCVLRVNTTPMQKVICMNRDARACDGN